GHPDGDAGLLHEGGPPRLVGGQRDHEPQVRRQAGGGRRAHGGRRPPEAAPHRLGRAASEGGSAESDRETSSTLAKKRRKLSPSTFFTSSSECPRRSSSSVMRGSLDTSSRPAGGSGIPSKSVPRPTASTPAMRITCSMWSTAFFQSVGARFGRPLMSLSSSSCRRLG